MASNCVMSRIVWRALTAALILAGGGAAAMEAPRNAETDIPDAFSERFRNFTVKRGLRSLTAIAQRNRADLKSHKISFMTAVQRGNTKVSGRRSIPVLLATYKNTGTEPYQSANLQRQLFGTWPTGTMTDYYREISYGALTVTGSVDPWSALPDDDTVYEGPNLPNGAHCHAMCLNGRMDKFIKDLVALDDPHIDFTQYDNDGADGISNSGDDDGYVDFIALVHPENGGECGNSNIWSHRFSYSELTGGAYETADVGKSGAKILIDDYVVMPALACDGTTMIEIGVFAHEFGHAFGLPDLYDTDKKNGRSSGIGGWGLMGSGSWGGNGEAPQRPSHMSAWEKEYLGWVTPTLIEADTAAINLHAMAASPHVLKIAVSDEEYYLVENRTRAGFDDSLPGSGLLVWRINTSAIMNGMQSNSVNADETRQGVELVEADGLGQLDLAERADAGDMFRGSFDRRLHDATTTPASSGTVALCSIGPMGVTNAIDVVVSRSKCKP